MADLEDEFLDGTLVRAPLIMVDEQISMAERYCRCRNMETCRCGENEDGTEWCWDEDTMTSACLLTKAGREVIFHPRFSVGTACVRADRPLRDGYQHYFELKILTPCFGTDIMIGLGTDKADIRKFERRFVSLLGCCNETWGLSYKGRIFHNDQWSEFHTGFGQGTLVGVHVDLWRGSLSYYINRKLIGVAFVNLRTPSANYYPMLSSTAAKSRFRLTAARSYTTNLQYFCCNAVRNAVPYGERYLPGVILPPALKLYLENNLTWLLVGAAARGKKRRMEDRDGMNSPDTPDSLSRSSSDHQSTLRGTARLAHFAHRLALIPMLTLQIDDHQSVSQPNSAPELRARTPPSSVSNIDEDSGTSETSDQEGPSGSEDGYVGPAAKRQCQ